MTARPMESSAAQTRRRPLVWQPGSRPQTLPQRPPPARAIRIRARKQRPPRPSIPRTASGGGCRAVRTATGRWEKQNTPNPTFPQQIKCSRRACPRDFQTQPQAHTFPCLAKRSDLRPHSWTPQIGYPPSMATLQHAISNTNGSATGSDDIALTAAPGSVGKPGGVTLVRAARPGWSAGPPAAGTPGSRCSCH